MALPRIITSYVFPPIPYRGCDWQACRDGAEPGDRVGHGKTEAESIRELMEQEEMDRE